jgi:hypothetical protein
VIKVNNFFDLKYKKVIGKEGKNIGKIINIINFSKDDSIEYYALLGIPRPIRRSIIFPLPLTKHKPIVTQKGDYIYLSVSSSALRRIAGKYDVERKKTKRSKSNRIEEEDITLALKLWNEL